MLLFLKPRFRYRERMRGRRAAEIREWQTIVDDRHEDDPGTKNAVRLAVSSTFDRFRPAASKISNVELIRRGEQ